MADQTGLDYSRLPAFGLPAPEEKKQNKGLIMPGLRSGVSDLESVLGSAAQGAGKLFGLPTVENFGRSVNQSAQAASAAEGRPDLEVSPLSLSPKQVLPFLAYQAAKQVPMLATYIAGGKAYGALGGRAPAELERLTTLAPRALGGGGLKAGADFAVRRAASEAGKDLATQLTGGAIAGLPIAFGSMYQEADSKPGGATIEDAKRAAIMSPIYSALDQVEPGQLKGLLSRGMAGTIFRRVATAAFAGAAMEVPQEGIQTAMEQSFRPDLTLQQKFSNIVDAAVTGGAVGGVFGGAGGIRAMKRANPAEIPTDDLAGVVDSFLSLPAPTQPGGPQVFAGGPTINMDQRANVPETAPSLFGPEAVPDRSAIPGSTMIFGRRGDDGRFTSEATGVEQPPVVPEDTSRAFRNFTDNELISARNALANRQEAGGLTDDQKQIAAAVDAELQFRNDSATNNVVPQGRRGGAAQAELAVGDGGTDSAAPVPVSWDDQRSDLLKDVSTRKRYADTQSKEELETAVRTRLENGSTAKGDFKLAERLGIDTNAPAATPVETTPARASNETQKASVAAQNPTAETPNAEFSAQWKQDVQQFGQKDKGARSIKPVDEADAQKKLYHALGRNTEIGDGLERLAQKYGILDDQKRLTPAAVEIASKEPISTETAVKAAMSQGFKGSDASMFERGVQAHLGGEQVTKFDNHRDFVAYNAGAQWAQEHNSVPRGALQKYEPSRYTGAVTDEQVAAMNSQPQAPQPRVIPEGVKEQQAANNTIDQANLSPVSQESDLATLKRMVREGNVKEAMDGLKRVQSGESLFQQPEAQRTDFKGEQATRGAPKTGQSTAVMVPTKAASRAEAERAIRKYEISRAIDAAHAEGAIDGKERLKLVAQLRQGRVNDVIKAIPVKFSGEKALRPTSLQSRTAQREAIRQQLNEAAQQAEQEGEVPELSVDDNGIIQERPAQFQGTIEEQQARALQDQLEGKTAEQVANMLMKHAPSEFHRQVAQKIRSTMAQLKRRGVHINFKIARAGDAAVPASLAEARGLTVDAAEGTTVWINGVDGPGPTGLHYEVVMHEMLHAVTMQMIEVVEHSGDYNSPLGQAVQRLQSVTDAIKAHFSNRVNQGNLTKLEQFIADSNALDDPHEVLAWALSSPSFQSYLDTIDYTPKQTLWGRFVEAMRNFLGLPVREDGALVEVLRASEQIMSLGPQEFDLVNAGSNAGAHMMRVSGDAFRTNETAQKVVETISKHVPIESAQAATRRMVFGWNTVGHLVAHYAKQFPQLALYARSHLERRATQARWAQLFEAPYQMYETLERNDAKGAEAIRYLMSLTEFNIDPTKPWDKHEHLHGAPNEARLKELTEAANRKYNVLRGKGQAKIYDDFRAINEATHFAMMSVSLHNLVISDPVLKEGISGFDTDPTDAFRQQASLHENAQNARRYWSDKLDSQVKNAEEYIQQLRGETVGSASEQRMQSMRLEPIEMRIRSIRESLNAMRDAPYFHLGRHGDHFVAFTLRVGEDKNVDPAAIDHAGKVISAAGFKHIEISRDSTRPNVYIRVETIEARQQLEKIVRQMQKDGWLKPDSEIKAAPRSSASDTGTADHAPAWLDRYIELLQASPMFEPTDNMTDSEKEQLAAKKAQMVSHARELWLDMLPDTAIAKIMVHRNAVPGFDKDMIRNFAFRFQVGVNSLSNLAASAKLNDAFTQMRAAVFDAQLASSDQHQNVDLMQSLLSEVLVREAQRPVRSGSNWIDTWRAINHAFFLGFSPSYVLVNSTQLGVLLWPELAKKHGFAKSAKAIASVTGAAFNIMRETLAAGARVGPKRALDAVITEDVLRKAEGVDEATANYLMKIIADGVIDIGGSSRELGRVAEGGVNEHLDTGLRWAASFGLYSETFTRLVAALAARKLNGDNIEYAHQVIDQSMLNYADWNTARQMGKMGFAGPLTKVMTAFQQYNAQVIEKLYREFHTAIGKDATAAKKAEAKRFLAGHAVAVTTLAGTLGMPFAAVMAMAIEKLVDLWDDDDQPFDANASWRNFLSSIFGKDIGEVIARGAPRAAGFDLSQRTGEQALLPFSQFLTDKRQWREASTELALRSAGAPVNMIVNIMQGGEKIGNGDVLGGLATMLPLSLKGPAQAYRMTTDGYVDANGNTLPMSPKASAVLAQLIGLTPQAKAEYSEARADQAGRESILVGRAKVLRQGIVDAVVSGDHDAARELIRRAQSFDKANPAFAVLPDIDKAVDRRMRAQALSAATKTPIGVSPKDLEGRALTNYANVEFAPQ